MTSSSGEAAESVPGPSIPSRGKLGSHAFLHEVDIRCLFKAEAGKAACDTTRAADWLTRLLWWRVKQAKVYTGSTKRLLKELEKIRICHVRRAERRGRKKGAFGSRSSKWKRHSKRLGKRRGPYLLRT